MGNLLGDPVGIAVDAAGNTYVTGTDSNNAFKITPAGLITQIIDATGDGAGNGLEDPIGIAADAAGNAYVTGNGTDNAFKISADANNNGISDVCDIAAGTSQDCNNNGIPDESDLDTDGDATIDDCENCPNDPNKVDPGVCGCGVSDVDTDADGLADCIDPEPDTELDANTQPTDGCGACGALGLVVWPVACLGYAVLLLMRRRSP